VKSIVVGRGAALRAWCKILDNHFHTPSDRSARPPSAPVIIGDGVEVGERSIVLPGAELGPGVRLDPGVVVARRVPAAARLAGSPPRIVKREAS
jgi:acetyltransferase-like isoleucine patch superfamily enzyme